MKANTRSPKTLGQAVNVLHRPLGWPGLTLFRLYRTVPFRVSSDTRSVKIQPTYGG